MRGYNPKKISEESSIKLFSMFEKLLTFSRDANSLWSQSWRKFFKGGTKG
jgi:hypothetical protein